ncbi:MAG TPA: ATP-binding protein, partial [Spirochaetales bacterium]|nr:ATP-binding protein [Spirochaetales bacterium]
ITKKSYCKTIFFDTILNMKAIQKSMLKAITQFNMLPKGAKVLVAVSGGKDSAALLWHLAEIANWNSYLLTLIPAVTSPLYPDPAWEKRLTFLNALCASLGLTLKVLSLDSEDCPEPVCKTGLERCTLKTEASESCFICSQLRRKILFRETYIEGCDCIAFGHHLDDILTTALMNILQHGSCEGMEPIRTYPQAGFKLIRPLVYVPEATIIKFRSMIGWDSYTCSCSIGAEGTRNEYRIRLEKLTEGSIQQKRNLLRGLYSNHLVNKFSEETVL